MRRVAVGFAVAFCSLWLAGCETTGTNPFAALAPASPSDPDATASTGAVAAVPAEPIADNTPTSTGVPGDDPHDDLNLGKQHYRQNSFGLAEQHFRRAVEKTPRNAEAWIGLAACYDKLRRFDLADRAYAQVVALIGETAEVLNNQGYSYLLRGDYRRARTKLLAARSKDPGNPYILNNLQLLDEAFAKRSGVQ
jgi:Flp pilus assembly protein TadD